METWIDFLSLWFRACWPILLGLFVFLSVGPLFNRLAYAFHRWAIYKIRSK